MSLGRVKGSESLLWIEHCQEAEAILILHRNNIFQDNIYQEVKRNETVISKGAVVIHFNQVSQLSLLCNKSSQNLAA